MCTSRRQVSESKLASMTTDEIFTKCFAIRKYGNNQKWFIQAILHSLTPSLTPSLTHSDNPDDSVH